MRPSSRRVLLVALVLCLLAIGAVVPGFARPPPRPLCDACGGSFEQTATGFGVDVTVQHSTAVVYAHENGSATWVVRNRLAPSSGVDRLRANASLLDSIADRAMWDVDLVSANLSDDGVLTIGYRDPEFGHPAFGATLRSGAFTESYGYGNIAGLGADRLTVVAPDGMRLASTVPGSTVSDDRGRMTLTSFSDQQEGHFVTFVPRNSILGPVSSLLALGLLLVPVLAMNVFAYLVVPCAALALLLGAVVSVLSRVPGRSERVRNVGGPALVALGAVLAAHPLYAWLVPGVDLFNAPLFGCGVAAVAFGGVLSRPTARTRVTYRTLVAGAVLAAVIAAFASIGGALLFNANGLTLWVRSHLSFGLPVFALLPAGYALGQGKRRLSVATVVVGFAAALVPLTPFLSPILGFGLILVALFLVYAVALAVLGVPLLVVGASLAPSASPGPTPTTTAD